MAKDLSRPLHAFGFKRFHGHDCVHQTHLERFLCAVLTAEVPNLPSLLLPYDAGEVARTETAVEASHAWSDLSEERVVRRECEIAYHVKNVPTTDRVARDKRDHHLRHGANQFLEIEDV